MGEDRGAFPGGLKDLSGTGVTRVSGDSKISRAILSKCNGKGPSMHLSDLNGMNGLTRRMGMKIFKFLRRSRVFCRNRRDGRKRFGKSINDEYFSGRVFSSTSPFPGDENDSLSSPADTQSLHFPLLRVNCFLRVGKTFSFYRRIFSRNPWTVERNIQRIRSVIRRETPSRIGWRNRSQASSPSPRVI